MIKDPMSWWKLLDDSFFFIEKIIARFTDRHHEAVYAKDGRDHEKLVEIMNEAWWKASDTNKILDIPGWGILCDLCSEFWVFEDHKDR
jgi:hypothetical protein